MSKNNNNKCNNNSNNTNNNNKEEILSSLSNKKRGNGEIIDLNAILSLDTRVKKKRVSKPQQQKQNQEQADDNNESNVPMDDEQQQTTITTVTVAATPIKWDEIQVDELDCKLLNEITFIAKSIGIATSSVRKHELIEKIKLLVKRNKDTVENKIKQDNINPFNKTSFTQLVIPEGQDGINELLFWKVFKNKSIYKRIMSFMNEYPNPLQYDYIISVKSMLDNNQISLLKEKVIRNQYLSFTGFKTIHHYFRHITTNFGPMTDVWLKLFQKIQNQEQDTEFYNHLFANYQYQIPYMDSNNKFKEIADLLIESNCLIGLQVLLQNFNYKPTTKNLSTAFGHSRPECIKLLRDEMPASIVFDKDQDIEITFDKKNAKIKKTIETLKLIIEIFNLSSAKVKLSQVEKYLCKDLFDINPLNLRLKDFIEIIGLVDTLNLWNKYDDLKNDFKYPPLISNIYKQRHQNSKSIKKEIKSYTFSTLQLKSKLKDPINCNSDKKENIKKLLHVFYRIANSTSITKKRHFIKYYLCYRGTGGDGDESYNNPIVSIDKAIGSEMHDNKIAKYSLQFGDYNTLKNWFSFSNLVSPINSIYGLFRAYDDDIVSKIHFIGDVIPTSNNKPSDLNILFKYCKDRELQIQFLNSVIGDIKSGVRNSNVIGNGVGYTGNVDQGQSDTFTMFMFIILVHYNDLDLLKHYVDSIGKPSITVLSQLSVQRIPNLRNKKNCFLNSLTRYVKSTEVMDYLFEEFYHLICITHTNTLTQTVTSSTTFQNQSLELLKHFQNLYVEKQKQQPQQPQQQPPPPPPPLQQQQQLQVQQLQNLQQLQLQLQQIQQQHLQLQQQLQQIQPQNTPPVQQIQQQAQQIQQLQQLQQLQQQQIQLQQQVQQQQLLQLQFQQQQIQQHLQLSQNKITVYGIHTPVLLVQHIFNNVSLYNISAIISTKPIDFDENEENKKIYFDSLRNAILSNLELKLNPLSFYYSCTVTEYPTKHFINYFKWLIKFQSDNPTHSFYDTNQKSHIDNNKLLQYFIHSDQLIQDETAFQISESGYFKAIIVYSIKRGDLHTLNRVLVILIDHLQELKTSATPAGIANVEKVSIKTFILKYILKVAINEEQILVLEYLLLNHNYIFRKTINSKNSVVEDDGLFTQQELRELVFTSLENYNIKITEFLLSLFTITKSQFEKHANPTSLIHFKNKFK